MGLGRTIRRAAGGALGLIANPVAAATLPFLGDLLGGEADRKAASDRLQEEKRMFYQQMAMQREFAQKGIQWKVEDAKKAGIAPLAALGNQNASYSPQAVNITGDYSKGRMFRDMGQNLSRAISATQTKREREITEVERIDAARKEMRMRELTETAAELEILKTATDINRANNPPAPEIDKGYEYIEMPGGVIRRELTPGSAMVKGSKSIGFGLNPDMLGTYINQVLGHILQKDIPPKSLMKGKRKYKWRWTGYEPTNEFSKQELMQMYQYRRPKGRKLRGVLRGRDR